MGLVVNPYHPLDLRRPCTTLRFMGVFAPETPWLRVLYAPYIFWALLNLALEVIFLFMGPSGAWDELPVVAVSICVGTSVFSGLVKASIFALRRQAVDRITFHIRSTVIDFGNNNKEMKTALLNEAQSKSKFMFNSYVGIGAVVVTAFITMPMVQNFKDADLIADEFNVTYHPGHRILEHNFPLQMWYPYPPNFSPYYELIYLKQCYWLLLIYLVTSAVDAFYITLIIYLTAQLKLLNIELMNVTDLSNELKDNEKENDSFDADTVNKSTFMQKESTGSDYKYDHLHRRLTECIRFHQNIITSVSELEQILSPAVLVQFLASTVIICCTAFVVTTVREKESLPIYISYLGVMFYELFIYCWYGNEILVESERLQLSAYSCGWPDAPKTFKKLVRLVMLHSNRPLKLTAGKFYSISRETFLLLLNGSYSYFALLNQVNGH